MEARSVILAAGVGTRMKSARPKVAHELLGKPLVRWVVDAAFDAGCGQVHVVTGTGREVVDPLLTDCTISHQDEMLGTGHTVMCAADALAGFDGTLVVLCGDAPLVTARTIRTLIDAHDAQKNAATILTMQLDDPTGYGRIVRMDSPEAAAPEAAAGAPDSSYAADSPYAAAPVAAIVEERDCTPDQRGIRECNSGAYCFDAPQLFASLDSLTTDNAQGEYYLTDVIGILISAGQRVGTVPADDPRECLGVNSRSELAHVTSIAQGCINERLMDAGVTMTDPSLVWVGPDVAVGRDCELLPMTFLMGETSIGGDSRIGPNTRLTDCTVGRNCEIEESVCTESVIDDDVTVGPRAYLRPGTHLCRGAHVGTHVELKKTTVGAGSKVPHLTYLGDATLGEGVNIGAGTITCNYDGRAKHPTKIGDGAFIGSDTMLVAPVSVGADAVTGASSCITKDVPDGALGIERSEQRNVEGYSERHS